MRYGHYFLSRAGVDYGLGLNSPFHPRFGKRFLQMFYAIPTWDFIFHKCFTPSDSRMLLTTTCARRNFNNETPPKD